MTMPFSLGFGRMRRAAVMCAAALVAACVFSGPAHEVLGDLPGVPNVVRLDDRLIRGGAPVGDEGMATLASLGVLTILSADSDEDEARCARAAGIDLVEIPFGYGGPTRSQMEEIALALRHAAGPVYVHCHHGTKRVGVLAGIWRMAYGDWTADEAADEMADLGCPPAYEALYGALDAFEAGWDGTRVRAVATAVADPLRVELDFGPTLMAAMDGLSAMDNVEEALHRVSLGTPIPLDKVTAIRTFLAGIQPADILQRGAPQEAAMGAFGALTAAQLDAAALEEAVRSGAGDAAGPAGRLLTRCVACHSTWRP